MSDKSPLFISTLELLAHATELYASDDPRKHKFVILHLANAVELILKDCLIDHGISIYKNPKETITVWGAFNKLEELQIAVPEKPVLELLIDDRNTIQHRFGFPNAESVFYYLEQIVAFFERFLDEQYHLQLDEALKPHMPEEHLVLIGLTKDTYGHLKEIARLSPQAATLQAYDELEARIREAYHPDKTQPVPPPLVARYLRELADAGYLPEGIEEQYYYLREVRNRAAHTSLVDMEDVDWQRSLSVAIEILSGLAKAQDDGLPNRNASSNEPQ